MLVFVCRRWGVCFFDRLLGACGFCFLFVCLSRFFLCFVCVCLLVCSFVFFVGFSFLLGGGSFLLCFVFI